MTPKNIIYKTADGETGTMDADTFVHDVCDHFSYPLIRLVDGHLHKDRDDTVYCIKVDDMYLDFDAERWYRGTAISFERLERVKNNAKVQR